jgi:predicted secreted protein
VSAQAKIAGSAYVTQVSLSAGVGGRVEYSASLQVSGAVTNGTF